MIGNSVELYNLVLQFLRTLFLRTKEEHYCSLRDELLMAFHDADIKEIRQVDPCHKFCWCLDACIRDRSIDSKRLKELQLFLDGVKGGEEQVMGDIAMVLNDPYATYTIVSSIIQQLLRLNNMDLLPRSSSELMFLIRLLSLSTSAWSIIKTQSFSETPVNPNIVTRFLPMLMSVMLDNTFGLLTGSDTAVIPQTMLDFSEQNPVAQTILSYYVNHLLQTNKRVLLDSLLPKFATILKGQPLNSPLLNLMVHSIVKHSDKFSEQGHCTLLCDEFLFIWLEHEDVLHHVLRILWNVHDKVEGQHMVELLTRTQPSPEHSESVHQLHQKLVHLIASTKGGKSQSNSTTPENRNAKGSGISPRARVSSPRSPAAFEAMETV